MASSPEDSHQQGKRQPETLQGVELSSASDLAQAVPTTGKRQSFRDIRRQLQEAELASPGVQKLLLEDLERAEAECDALQGYVQRYHDSDKRAAVLEERVRSQTAFEILFGVGITLGGTIVGLAPFLWDTTAKGPIALAVGFLLIVGSSAARMVKR